MTTTTVQRLDKILTVLFLTVWGWLFGSGFDRMIRAFTSGALEIDSIEKAAGTITAFVFVGSLWIGGIYVFLYVPIFFRRIDND